jgi:hypothetical protein
VLVPRLFAPPPPAMLSRSLAVLACALPLLVSADVYTGKPDPAPAGYEQWTSPIVTPAKNITGDGGWAAAVAKARQFVSQLTLEEKINVTTGVDVYNRCVGNTGVSTLRYITSDTADDAAPRPSPAWAGRAFASRTRRLVSVSPTLRLLCKLLPLSCLLAKL